MKKVRNVVARDPAQQPGKLKMIGGSASDDWNNVLATQAIRTVWVQHSDEDALDQQLAATTAALIGIDQHSDEDALDQQLAATTAALIGIGPKDELEGMIAAQLLAAHNASMECYRRAMIPQQSLESRRENLNQANKLSRTYATLLESLNRHRGKGQQKVMVEHVHVHAGGQAVVGMVEAPGGGAGPKSEDQAHAKQIAHAPQPPMSGADAQRERVQVSSDAERAVPDARRKVTRRSKA